MNLHKRHQIWETLFKFSFLEFLSLQQKQEIAPDVSIDQAWDANMVSQTDARQT